MFTPSSVEFGSGKVIQFGENTLVYAVFAIIVGFQLMLFYMLTKKYASITGFIPITDRDKFWLRCTMNKGIFVGALLEIIGLVGTVIAFVIWSKTSFGNLGPEIMLRITMPIFVALVCGIQLMCSSFFLGILEIKVKKK
jgi:hypothetical protein